VKKYQKEHKLNKITGIIGDSNWKYLFDKDNKNNKPKEKYHRVYVNGKQVASYKEEVNVTDRVVEQVKKALASNDKKLEIRIERVMLCCACRWIFSRTSLKKLLGKR